MRTPLRPLEQVVFDYAKSKSRQAGFSHDPNPQALIRECIRLTGCKEEVIDIPRVVEEFRHWRASFATAKLGSAERKFHTVEWKIGDGPDDPVVGLGRFIRNAYGLWFTPPLVDEDGKRVDIMSVSGVGVFPSEDRRKAYFTWLDSDNDIVETINTCREVDSETLTLILQDLWRRGLILPGDYLIYGDLDE